MIGRIVVTMIGGAFGGALPRAVLAAADVGPVPNWASIGISAATGTAGALLVLYSLAPTRRECAEKHHNVNNKISGADLKAVAATAAIQELRGEFLEFRGEVKAELKNASSKLDGIARHLGVT